MKTRRIATHSLAVVAGVTIGLLLPGYASTRIKQLTGAEFLARAQQMELVSSFNWTTYIGSSRQRAYLEFGRPSLLYNIIGKETRTTVYWAELSELPADIADQLKAGNPPWKPWRTKANKTERTIEFTVPK